MKLPKDRVPYSSIVQRCIAVLAAALVAGCTTEIGTNPETFSLGPAALSHLRRPQAVALENAYPADTKVELKLTGGNTWIIELRRLTQTSIAMLVRGMESQGIAVAPDAPKRVTLRVSDLLASPGYTIFARLTLEARFADGTSTSIQADNRSPVSADRAFDGAVMFALNKLVYDEKFIAYMNK
jgi:hypothetical protein